MRQTLLLLCLLLAQGIAHAQYAVKRAELFYDADPGVGNGIPLSLTAGDTVAFTATLEVPTGLSFGTHKVYVRTWCDSSGYNGRWSLTGSRRFFIAGSQLTTAEYFFDADPGIGNGIAIVTGAAADSIAFNANITVPSGMAAGYHRLYVRTRAGGNGAWSLSAAKPFYVAGTGSQITYLEYFYDTDPGFGNGTALTVATPADSINQSYAIGSSGLNAGIHYLYIRSRTAGGKWSLLSQGRRIYVNNAVASVEYFLDADPGQGNGTPISCSSGDSVAFASSITIPATTTSGYHYLYLRSHSSNGSWSLTARQRFYVNPSIVASEYYFDTDPGTGNGTALLPFAAADSINKNFSITAPCLGPGGHHLYVRSRDNHGVWSLTGADSIFFANPAMTATAVYPGPGPYGTPVKVTGSGGQAPYTYQTISGFPTTDSIFLIANNSTETLVATDACGYADSADVTTPTAPANIASAPTGTGSMMLNGWRNWVYITNTGGDIIGAVNDKGENLGTVTISYLKNTSGTVRRFSAGNGSAFYLDRNWHIEAPPGGTTPRGVQLYALNEEYNALTDSDAAITSYNNLRITQYDGPNEDLAYNNNAAYGSTLISPDSAVVYTGTATTGYHLDFRTNNFSEFYQSRDYSIPLFNRNVTLQAQLITDAVLLTWQCNDEHGLQSYAIQKLNTDNRWTTLETLPPLQGLQNYYQSRDNQPTDGTSYYRLQLTDNDGSITYAPIVQIFVNKTAAIAVYPNPVQGLLHIAGLQPGSIISLTDAAGHTIFRSIATQPNMNIITDTYSAGTYLLQVSGNSQTATQRLTLEQP